MSSLNLGKAYNSGYHAGVPVAEEIFEIVKTKLAVDLLEVEDPYVMSHYAEGFISAITRRFSDTEEVLNIVDYNKIKYGDHI